MLRSARRPPALVLEDADPVPTVMVSAAVRHGGGGSPAGAVVYPMARAGTAPLPGRRLRRRRSPRASPCGSPLQKAAQSARRRPRKIPPHLATAIPAVAMEKPAPQLPSGAVPPEAPEFRELVGGYITALRNEALQAVAAHSRNVSFSSIDAGFGPLRVSEGSGLGASSPDSIPSPASFLLALPPSSPYLKRIARKAQVRCEELARGVIDFRAPPRKRLLPWEVDKALQPEPDDTTSTVPYRPRNPFFLSRTPANPDPNDVWLPLERPRSKQSSCLRTFRKELKERKDNELTYGEGQVWMDRIVTAESPSHGRSPSHEDWVNSACEASLRVGGSSRAAHAQLADYCADGRPRCPTPEQLHRRSEWRRERERERDRQQMQARLRQARASDRRSLRASFASDIPSRRTSGAPSRRASEQSSECEPMRVEPLTPAITTTAPAH
eukprot:TRINITY_DN23001_c0_g1_i1.p1 TRINITY_DN23001_c0_g1~~TRINITY_DN23001_c0_g1_i1.p1  ORF type:complete len:464 (+),score=131.76 TRINITY_DN23001_c0_g1_i1:74-1393(+)